LLSEQKRFVIMDQKILSQKNLVVIGGTGGLGLSAARAFIAYGARIVVAGRTDESASEALSVLGSDARAVVGDATSPSTAVETIETCLQHFGGFHGLYHVAGGSGRKWGDGPLHELTLEGWNKTLEMNLTSLMLSCQAAVRQFMKSGGGGTILNMGSVLGFSPSPRYFSTHAYAACKSAVTGFTKSIASYYAPHNIRINAVAPALVETSMSERAAADDKIMSYIRTRQPLGGGRIGHPSDLDGLAVYFMSDLSRFTTGQVISVDGGWSVSEGQFSE
jgi:NAD(P)-dependent dehydrogenase (short-subunit alcohol dehydrogenase family)